MMSYVIVCIACPEGPVKVRKSNPKVDRLWISFRRLCILSLLDVGDKRICMTVTIEVYSSSLSLLFMHIFLANIQNTYFPFSKDFTLFT